jgi:dienelactone hydrolase
MAGYEQGLSRPSSPTVKDGLTVVDYPQELRWSLPERNKFEPVQTVMDSAKAVARILAFSALLAASCADSTLAQPLPGPEGPEQGAFRQQLWLVPSQDRSVLMRTVMFRPSGAGPFPLVVINHGSVQNEDKRTEFQQPVFRAASEWFVQRGYAVAVPQRPGHGETGGPYLESNTRAGGCANADYRASGLATADSIQAAIDYLVQQPFVKKTDVIVVGQSAGGWGSLALASRNPRNVKAIINFAGGRGGRVGDRPNNNCASDKLIDVARSFGASARIPVLSIYTENDTYFAPSISKPLNEAFRMAGGHIDFRLLPPFGLDGHMLLGSRSGVEQWGPLVDEFLKTMR